MISNLKLLKKIKFMLTLLLMFTFLILIGGCTSKYMSSTFVEDLENNSNTDLVRILEVDRKVSSVDKANEEIAKADRFEEFSLNFKKLLAVDKKVRKRFKKNLKKGKSRISSVKKEFNKMEVNNRSKKLKAERKDSKRIALGLKKFDQMFVAKLLSFLKRDNCSNTADLKSIVRLKVIECLGDNNITISWRTKFTPTKDLIVKHENCYNMVVNKDVLKVIEEDKQCILDRYKEGKFISPLNLIRKTDE